MKDRTCVEDPREFLKSVKVEVFAENGQFVLALVIPESSYLLGAARFTPGERSPEYIGVMNETLYRDLLEDFMQKDGQDPVPREDLEYAVEEAFGYHIPCFSIPMFCYLYESGMFPAQPLFSQEEGKQLIADREEQLIRDGTIGKPGFKDFYGTERRKAYLDLIYVDGKEVLRGLLYEGGRLLCSFLKTPEAYYLDSPYLDSPTLFARRSTACTFESLLAVSCYESQEPGIHLQQYLKGTESNILIPLFGKYYHKAKELLASSGCSALAEDTPASLLLENPWSYRNLQEATGLPVSLLRCLGRDVTGNFADPIDVLRRCRSRNPEYFEKKSVSACMLEFLSDADRLTEGWTAAMKKRVVEYLRKIPDHDFYFLYAIYLETIRRVDEEPDGRFSLTPDEPIRTAMRRVMDAEKECPDSEEVRLCNLRLRSPSYRGYAATGRTFRVVAPKSFAEIRHESTKLHNCLKLYAPKIAEGHVKIFFLRKNTDPEKPYAAIEVRFGGVTQLKTYCNRATSRAAQEYVASWAKEHELVLYDGDFPAVEGTRTEILSDELIDFMDLMNVDELPF